MNKKIIYATLLIIGVLLGIVIHRYILSIDEMRFGSSGDVYSFSKPIDFTRAKDCVERYQNGLLTYFLRNKEGDKLHGWAIDDTVLVGLRNKFGNNPAKPIKGYQLYIARMDGVGEDKDHYSLVIGAYTGTGATKELLLDGPNCADCLYEYIDPCPDQCPMLNTSPPWKNP